MLYLESAFEQAWQIFLSERSPERIEIKGAKEQRHKGTEEKLCASEPLNLCASKLEISLFAIISPVSWMRQSRYMKIF
ncbi:MAG: hypothetical protein HC887_00575 [Desulfobacteraceae bacterium]|nr:hypothetical protein [Desulfobacteraceae bacterium]